MESRYDPYYPTPYKRVNPAGKPPKDNNPNRPMPPQGNPFAPQPFTGMSIGNWIGTLLLTCIPILNIILYFYWAFSKKTKPSKKSWARAILILSLVLLVIVGVLAFVLIYVIGINFAELLGSAA